MRNRIRNSIFRLARKDIIDFLDEHEEDLLQIFREELQKYLKGNLLQTGKRIIDACLSGASVDEYNDIVPNSYSYAFSNLEDFETNNSH